MTRSPRATTPRRSPRSVATSFDAAHGHGNGNWHGWLRAALLVAAVALPLLVLYMASDPSELSFFSFGRAGTGPAAKPVAVTAVSETVETVTVVDDGADLDNEPDKLETVLKQAAMEDKTVILTTLNEAWAAPNSVLDVFIKSFHLGDGTRNLLDHLVMVALDQKAYDQCNSIHPYCYALTTEGVDFSGQQGFMSDGYLRMMWRRIDFLRLVLEMGYNFIFTDTDIVWFRNPMPHFYPDGDFQIACDRFFGNPLDVNNWPNGGFNYVKSNNRTIEFYKFWYLAREKHPGKHDQDVLNFIKYDPFIQQVGLQIRFLDTAYFGGLCEPSKDFNKVCTMHANCCIGLARKINDLGVMLEDWRSFMSLPPALKRSRQHHWRVPQNCSLS